MKTTMRISNIQKQSDPSINESEMYATFKQESDEKTFKIPPGITDISLTLLDKEKVFICIDSLQE